MKRKLLFAAMTLIAGAWSLSASAQTWAGNEPAEGTFFLYNVEAQKFLNNGDPTQEWGTNAYLQANFGLDIILEANGEAYNLNTRVSNGGNSHYLGTSTWCDGGATPWTFTAVAGQEKTYTIKNDEKFLVANDALNDVEYKESTNDAKSWWKLVSIDDFKKAMQAKAFSTTDPMDVSVFIQGRSFARNDGRNSSWITTHNGGNWDWIGASDNKYYGNESWNNTFSVSQTITGLPNGTYEVRCSGFGTNGTTYIFGNTTSKAIQTDNTTSYGTNKQAKWKAIHEDNAFAGQSTGTIIIADGTLTLGVKRENNNGGDWAIWDEFRLYYYGLDLSSFQTALSEALNTAKAINAPMNADVASALATAISKYDGQTYDNEDDYGTAIAEVNTAIANANTSVANYAAVKAAIDNANTNVVTLDADGQAAFDISAIETAYANGTITNVDYATCITNINNALRAAAKAQTTPGSDMTLAIVNPGIDGNADGWTTYINGNGGYAGGPMKPSNDAMEFWGAGTLTDQDKGKSFDYYQIITELPAGVYTIGADMLNSTNGEDGSDWNGGGKAGLYGKTQTAEVKALITFDGETFISYTTDEITVINGELRIGVKNFESLTGRWFACDNFRLTYVGPVQDLTPYIDAYDTAKAAAEITSAKTDKMAASIRTELDATIAATVDQTSQEELENATAALVEITAKAEKSLASYAVIKSGVIPDNSLEGWVCENSNTFHINTWSVEGNPGNDPSGMVTPFIENWVGKGSYLGAGKVYYKLEYLEPGEQFYAQAHVRSYNEANADAPNGPDFFINDNTTKLSEEGTTFTYNGMSGIYATLEGTATVGADGTLTLGVDIAADRNYNWVAFKSVKIQALEEVLTAVNKDLNDAISDAYTTMNIISNLMTTISGSTVRWVDFMYGVESIALDNALDAAANVDHSDIPAIKEATANLIASNNVYFNAAHSYERAAMIIAIAPAYGVDVTGLVAAQNDPETTAASISVISNTILTTVANQALASSKVNQAGFEVGEYAPYNNADGFALVETATAIGANPAGYTNSQLYNTFASLAAYSWTENTEEVNAFYDGDFSECAEDNASPLDYTPAGWTASSNMRMMLKNAETYPGLADASATTAMMSWSGGITYGETAGYKMPLKANTIYTLKLKAAGWNNESRSGISVSVLNGNEGMALYNLGTPDCDIKGNATNTAGMTSYEFAFVTGAAGNYVFHVQSGNNLVVTDFELKKAASQTLEISENDDKAKCAPGTYSEVSLKRTLKGGQWNGFSVPFGFDITGSALDGAEVMKFSSAIGETINLEDAIVIEPGVPYLVRPVVDITDPTFYGVEVSNPAEVKEGTGDYTFQAHLYNTPLDLDGSVAYVSTTDNSIKKLTSGGIKGLRAIFNIPTVSEAKALVVNFGDGTTGILNVDSEGNVYEGNVYNIAGQRVNMTKKGLYIVNGKKVLIK